MQTVREPLQGKLADTFTVVREANGVETLAIVFKTADQQEVQLTETEFRNGSKVTLPAEAQAKATHMFKTAQTCQGTLEVLGRFVPAGPFANSVNQILRWKL